MIERRNLLTDLPEEPERGFGGGGRKKELKMKTIISTIFLVLATISPAFAGDSSAVYKSGILVSVFVGICALIVVAQLVPALILFLGFIKSSAALAKQRMVISSHDPWMFGVHQGADGDRKEAPAIESMTNGD